MKILVAPLDWGLGHAARCIPVIKYLLGKKCEVIIGADGRPLHLLQNEFPSLECIVMPGYNISYPESGSMALKIAAQVPKILSGIKKEHDLLKKIIREKKVDAVISDNRYGLWSREVPCVFITHQLMVKSPFGEKWIHRLNKKYISKFTECWVPDRPEDGLCGDLAHKYPLPPNAKYIGLLSRFSANLQGIVPKRELLVILSGPEPQRTLFEKMIINQLSSSPREGKVLIVQGITERKNRNKISKYVEMVSHLTADELHKEIFSSEIILSRPGYSTVMDLVVLGRKAIFVPTPGQTEQEYIANYFSDKNIAYSVSQKKFDLETAWRESKIYSGFTGSYPCEDFKWAVDLFVSRRDAEIAVSS